VRRGAVSGVRYRRITPHDRGSIVDMHRRCTPTTRYRRWHAPLVDVPDVYLDALTSNCPDQIGVVATSDECVVGLGSASRTADDTWEIGLLVEDAFQRKGVGSALLQALVDGIADARPRHLCAHILVDGRWALDILRRHGPLRVTWDASGLHVLVALTNQCRP
jgi:GNAT superfamily N-acetyltransferase